MFCMSLVLPEGVLYCRQRFIYIYLFIEENSNKNNERGTDFLRNSDKYFLKSLSLLSFIPQKLNYFLSQNVLSVDDWY